MNDELHNRIKALSDEELLNMVDGDSQDFTEEALQIAKDEAKARGGTEALCKKVEAEMAEVQRREEAEKAKEEELERERHKRELHAPRPKSLFSETRKLKDETISHYSQRMILGASGHAEKVIQDIEEMIGAVKMPLKCQWGVVEVKTKHLISRVRRGFLIVDCDDFPDHHVYMSIRDFGVFLDCIILFTVEPGTIKKFFSKKLTGTNDVEALSRPRNIMKLQDYNSWRLAVESCYNRSIDALIEKLDKKPHEILKREKSFLDIW